MKDFEKIRSINQIETEIIKDSFLTISSNFASLLEDVRNNLYVIFKEKKDYNNFPKIYLLPKELQELLNNPKLKSSISSGGLYFGFIKKGKFYFSIEGAEFLFKSNLIATDLQLNVNWDGEKSILYGNNISKNMLLKESYNFKIKDILIMLNEEQEIIAISKAVVEGNQVQNLEPEELIAINLSDKGTYLREKQ
jgi:ribosome biogenesis protein Nip4